MACQTLILRRERQDGSEPVTPTGPDQSRPSTALRLAAVMSLFAISFILTSALLGDGIHAGTLVFSAVLAIVMGLGCALKWRHGSKGHMHENIEENPQS